MRTQTENGLLAKAFLVFYAMFALKTGIFMLTFEQRNINSDIYEALAGVVALDVYAYVFIALGIAYIHASVLPTGIRRSWTLICAGIIGGLMYGLYAMAAYEMAYSFYSPLRYAITASFHLIIAVIGGWSLWTMKRVSK